MTPKYGQRFIEALAYAADKHRPQVRKFKRGVEPDYERDVPYVAHLLAVAAIVFEAGGNEDAAIAGLLHDVVEDQEVKLEEIESRFGAEVTRIVDACSEHWNQDFAKPAWDVRKQEHLARLRTEDSTVLLVTSADKIHNGESILHDIAVHGSPVWDRFNTDADKILWYYSEVSKVVIDVLGHDSYAAKRLAKVVAGLAHEVASHLQTDGSDIDVAETPDTTTTSTASTSLPGNTGSSNSGSTRV